MWNPFRLARERRAAEHQAFLEALKTVASIVTAQCNATEKVAEVLLAQLDMYKVEGKPTSRAHNDTTEAILELERLQALKERGFPVEGSLLDQYSFALHSSDGF